MSAFRVGVTADISTPDGRLAFAGLDLSTLEREPGVEWAFLPDDGGEIGPERAAEWDAFLVFAPRVTERTLSGGGRVRCVARLGVGVDNVDVEACTRRGIPVTVTPDAVRRPVAAAALALLLALAHRLLVKDRLVREGRWHDRFDHLGSGLTGRTVGIVGLGNIGRDLASLLPPLDVVVLGHDPFVDGVPGVEPVTLDELLARSDYVVLALPLTPRTHHLLDAERLARMKPGARLVNVARGGLVETGALVEALRSGRLAGAALDVFEEEPLPVDHPLLALPDVVVAPHALAHTDEWLRLSGRSACESILEARAGRVPRHAVNRRALEGGTA